jgi:hypothetical protein
LNELSPEVREATVRYGPCFTEAEFKAMGLLPVPEWARRPPEPHEPGLFDDM